MLFVGRQGAAHALSALRVFRACRRLLVEVKIPLDLPPCEVRRVGEEGASEDVWGGGRLMEAGRDTRRLRCMPRERERE
jgi:hypothetical protein